MRIAGLLLALLLLGCAHPVQAEEKIVCTITVNSSDEKEAFRHGLPEDKFRLVELLEKGREDWLHSACEKAIACDVLVISGHFNAGDAFYSDRPDSNEYLRLDELERASCSESCPALFSRLKEVYLFGCESLNPDASKYASSHGDSGAERMRRIFANVPVIYGFPMAAPAGAAAASRLERYFDSGANEVGSGQRSSRLLAMFSANGMTATRGVSESHAYRRQVCSFFDERLGPAQKLAFIHATMRRDIAQASAFVQRSEWLLASLTETERNSSDFHLALAEISADDTTRSRYLAAERAAAEPASRARMIDLAATLGWLSPEERAAERVGMINDLLAGRAPGFAEVEAICSLNETGELDHELAHVSVPPARAGSSAVAAARACLGDDAARARVLAALTSTDERDVQVAQVYLRHRPATGTLELRALARNIGHMPRTGAQVRALETLGRLHIADREIVDELARSFAAAKSLEVQRAIAEIFLRADSNTIARAGLEDTLRSHRLASRDGEDLIDVLIRRLGATPPSSGS